MEDRYIDFFENIKILKEKQQKQKERGLNDYNLLTTVLNAHDEVRLHSRMLASLLDIEGNHYQNELFLEKFIEILNFNNFEYDLGNSKIYLEYKNIDLYLTDGLNHIILENKIYAGDQKHQIKRYIEIIKEENNNLECQNILVIYLSIDRNQPSEYSLDNLKVKNDFIYDDENAITLFKNINYKNEIITWLNRCIFEVQNITNLNESIKQYLTVVEKITNKYEGKVMKIEDELLKNKEYLKLAFELEQIVPKLKKSVIDNFFDEVHNILLTQLDSNWEIEINKNSLSTRFGAPIKIYKKSWINDNGYIHLSFEFDRNNYEKGFCGVIRNSDKVNTQRIYEKFKNDFETLPNDFRSKNGTTKWWPFYQKKSIPNLVDKINFEDYKPQDFVNTISEYIEVLENHNNLLTKINKYIQEDI